MSKTHFSNMVKILSEFWVYVRGNVEDRVWIEFIEDNTDSLVLAYLLSNNAVSISDNASGNIVMDELTQTWNTFCEYVNIPNDIEYRDLEEAFASRIWRDGEY